MTHAHALSFADWGRWAGRFVEHAVAIVIGFAMMVVGLGLGVTMVMLPVGLVIGLLGFALFVGGIFARLDEKTHA